MNSFTKQPVGSGFPFAGVRWNFSWKRLLLIVALACALTSIADAQNIAQPDIKKTLELAQKNEQAGDLKEATRYLNEAAMTLWEEKKYDEAITQFNHSIELNQRLKNFSGIAKLNSNLGMIYSDKNEPENSLAYFQKALDYRLREGEKTEIISTYINIGVVQNNLKQYNDAASNLEKALELASEMNDAAQMKSCYGMLAETYEKMGNQEKTRYYFDLYRTFHEMIQRNKLNDAKKETEAAKMQALQSELAEKDKELQLLTAKKELGSTEAELKNLNKEARTLVEKNTKQQLAMSLLQREVELDQMRLRETLAQNTQQRMLITFGLIALIGALIIAGLSYRNYLFKKKTNGQLAEQNEEIRALNEGLEGQVRQRTTELQRAITRLEKRNQELDQFSSVISHNLRGPVASILGLGKVLNSKDPSDPINYEVFERLIVATRNLDTVIKDLSLIIQVRDHQMPREKMNVEQAMGTVMNLLGEEIEKSKAQVKLEVKSAREVVAVKPYVESVLFNLMSNAVKYRDVSRALKIKVKTWIEGNDAFLSVTDNGKGIPAHQIDQVFQPYKRLTMEGEGKGLGLYLVKSQVEAMGGRVEVVSEEGKGSTFTMVLPLNADFLPNGGTNLIVPKPDFTAQMSTTV